MDDELRIAAFGWIAEQHSVHGGVVPRSELVHGFTVGGRRFAAVGPTGIWRPRGFQLPLSITTAPDSPYDDSWTPDELLRYRYRGSDPAHRDNVGLREAMRTRTPLIYFFGAMPNRYIPVWPVFILEDRPQDLSFVVAVDPAYAFGVGAPTADLVTKLDPGSALGIQRYVTSVTKRRLHQATFRERVVTAYAATCTLCSLRHRELLDAAHIIPDAQHGGEPVVPNGLCLCKIHHAAFDQNIIGVSPDYLVHVRSDILEEVDGPMLQHGLQGLHGKQILLPRHRTDRPDRDRLSMRFEQFRKAG
jgi:putative restriction endonuclease